MITDPPHLDPRLSDTRHLTCDTWLHQLEVAPKIHLVVRDAGEGEGDVADLMGPDLLVLLGVDDEDLVVLVPPLGRHRCLHGEPFPLPVAGLGTSPSPLTPTWRLGGNNRGTRRASRLYGAAR